MSGAIFFAYGGGTWDLSTIAYTSNNLPLSSQTTNPRSVRLSEDGTKAYVLDTTNDIIYQYTLSTPFDISTGSYASKSLSASSETSNANAFTISRDGSTAYIADYTAQIIYQYSLATPWDMSTGSYASKSYDASAQGADIYGIFLSPDGTKLFINGYPGSAPSYIYQYTLSTPYDISSASYDSKSLSLAASTAGFDLYIKNDGTRIFYITAIIGFRYLKQRSLSTPWDISTAGSVENTVGPLSEDSAPQGICFSQDGLRIYVSGDSYNSIFQYSLD